MRLLRGLSFLILFSLAMISPSETVSAQPMLSSTEFLALDESVQLQYLKTIQDILIELELNPEAYSQFNFKFVDWLLPSANAQRMAVQERIFIFHPGQELKPAQNIVDQMKAKVLRNERLSPEDQKQLQIALSMMISEIRRAGDIGAAERRNRALNAFKQSQEFFTSSQNQSRIDKSTQHFILAQRNIVNRIQNEKPSPPASHSPRPPRDTQRKQNNPRLNPASSQSPSASRPVPARAPVNSLPKTGSVPKVNMAILNPSEPKKDSSKPDSSQWSFSGCILGGFALTEDQCKVPKELPQEFLKNQKTLNAKDFVCENELALCNPLIFGYDCASSDSDGFCPESQKPICLAPKLSLTKDCRNRSASPNHLKRALDLIKKEPKLFDQFNKNFELICDESKVDKNRFVYFKIDGALRKNSDHIKQDLIQTCRAAKIRLDDIKKSLILTPEAPAKPKSKGQGRK